MAFDIFSVETSVKAKLETITNFKIVYDHYTLKTTGYPFASFELGDFDGTFADTCSNFSVIDMNVVIIQVVNADVSRDLAKQIIYKCLNAVKNAFESDMTLGNSNIIRGEVIKGNMGTVIGGPDGDSLALSLQVRLTVNNSII